MCHGLAPYNMPRFSCFYFVPRFRCFYYMQYFIITCTFYMGVRVVFQVTLALSVNSKFVLSHIS